MAAAATAMPASWGDLACETPLEATPVRPSPPPAAGGGAGAGAPRSAPKPVFTPRKTGGGAGAARGAPVKAPRGFALLAEEDEKETEKAVAAAAAMVAAAVAPPKPAPVVKMPTVMTEAEREAQESDYRFTLRVANLPMDITKRGLEEIFSEFTGFKEVTLPLKMGKPRGFAFILFSNPEDAGDCLYELCDTLEIRGKRVDGQTHKVILEYAKTNVAPSRT